MRLALPPGARPPPRPALDAEMQHWNVLQLQRQAPIKEEVAPPGSPHKRSAMEISRNSQSQSNPLRFDPTRPARESIKDRQPLSEPVKSDAQPAVDPEQAAKQVKEARDAHRDARQTRIANARAHYTEKNAPRFAQQVTNARNEYRAELDKRAKNTQGPGSASNDQIEISAESKKLVDRALSMARTSDDARAERLAELKELHQQGRLNADELIARAAHRMLAGE